MNKVFSDVETSRDERTSDDTTMVTWRKKQLPTKISNSKNEYANDVIEIIAYSVQCTVVESTVVQ
jgi:hypothetical protein